MIFSKLIDAIKWVWSGLDEDEIEGIEKKKFEKKKEEKTTKRVYRKKNLGTGGNKKLTKEFL